MYKYVRVLLAGLSKYLCCRIFQKQLFILIQISNNTVCYMCDARNLFLYPQDIVYKCVNTTLYFLPLVEWIAFFKKKSSFSSALLFLAVVVMITTWQLISHAEETENIKNIMDTSQANINKSSFLFFAHSIKCFITSVIKQKSSCVKLSWHHTLWCPSRLLLIVLWHGKSWQSAIFHDTFMTWLP